MLGKKDAEVRITTLLGSTTEITGDFVVDGSARVDGRITGNVTVTGTLIVGVTGSIKGNVTADMVMIGGEVIGDIIVKNKTEFTSTARIFGDVTTTTIVIDEYAVFQGGCNMNREPGDKKPNNAKAVRSDKKSARDLMDGALRDAEEGSRREGQNYSEE